MLYELTFCLELSEIAVAMLSVPATHATKGDALDKPWTFRADPRTIPLLNKHFHALSIANNHTGDFGPEAFVEMLDLCQGRLTLFGGGRNKKEARQPLVLEKNVMWSRFDRPPPVG